MIVVGIDEVGRGCWAGPLVAGAVILDESLDGIDGLADSKQLSAPCREALAASIHQTAAAVGLGWVDAWEIDELGLSQALTMAMQRALQQISLAFDAIVIDGAVNYLPDYLQAQTIVKADSSVAAVSAASIVAKVARDDYLKQILHNLYPTYGFDQHVGYGTALHSAMLQRHGVTAQHRRSFKPIKALLGQTA